MSVLGNPPAEGGGPAQGPEEHREPEQGQRTDGQDAEERPGMMSPDSDHVQRFSSSAARPP